MEKVISTALLIIASVVASLALINAVMPALGKSSSALVTANKSAAERIKTDIDIVHATGDTGTNTVTVWVKNIGPQVIKVISDSDVFLTKPSSVVRLPYGDGCSSNCWDFTIEGSSVDWSQAVTVKFTLYTAMAVGTHTISVAVFNAVSASKDFSV
tara:strand:- start:8464 stop:8931 length:468 start_codon:yes stop_codon:yes gene_type:complete